MRKLPLLCLLGIIAVVHLNAQHPVSVSGQVQDVQNKPLVGVSVILLQARDSVTAVSAISNEKGAFLLPGVKPGSYIVSATALQHRTWYSKPIDIRQNLVLPVITLYDSSRQLAAVTVSATKPFTEQKIDRTIVNVDALISNAGANALEALEKTPGVLVDENGAITFKGKSSVLILIDDKPTYLSAADLAAYLRSLPASALDKIELMDNPPAKYDAAGNGGVINIKTKKAKNKGFNGSVSASYGQSFYARTSESLNLNYYTGKVNLFANLGYSINKGHRELAVSRTYLDGAGNTASVFTQTNYFSPYGTSPSAKIGFDYYVSPKTTWGIVYTGSAFNRSDYRPTFSYLYNKTGSLDSSITANNRNTSRFDKSGINLNFTHSIDTAGRSISFDMDYINYRSNSDQSFLNTIYTAAGSAKSQQQISAEVPSVIDIYAAKADYTQMLGKTKMETGIKSSFVTSDNEADYFNVNGGLRTVDYNNTNRFIYKENINAAYLSLNRTLKRITLQAGLRLENTNGSGHQLGNLYRPDSAFTKHYTSLFPTAYLSYKLDSAGNDLLNLSMGRRIDRPNYQDLNPFVFILDKFTYFSGNPFLKPQYSTELKLAWSHRNKITLSAQYNRITDVQIETIEQNGTAFISRNGNIGAWDYLALSVDMNLRFTKWWTANLYSDFLNYMEYHGVLYTGRIDISSLYFYGTMNNQFTIGKGWSAELSGFYLSHRTNGQFDKIPFGQVNTGLQKKILNNNGSIRFNVRDIFNTNTSTGNITNVPGVIASYRNNFYGQTFTLSFSYNFGRQANTAQKRKTGSADTEAGRAGN
ncbi:MAG: outer membrane beta-barrel protein [Chitinophagaceae bacterium]|nr:outer membrane beta-barrel protein [Chitinophagaceae bacterium]